MLTIYNFDSIQTFSKSALLFTNHIMKAPTPNLTNRDERLSLQTVNV